MAKGGSPYMESRPPAEWPSAEWRGSPYPESWRPAELPSAEWRDNDGMRLTDFWERMRAEFGPTAEFMAESHVFSELGNRTVAQALAAGEPALQVWRAVCEGMAVPPHRR